MSEKDSICAMIDNSTLKIVISSNRVCQNSEIDIQIASVIINKDGKIECFISHNSKEARITFLDMVRDEIKKKETLSDITSDGKVDDLSKLNPIVEDFQDMIIMPGIIDMHTHMQAKMKERWEGFDYGTKAAASGGVTTIVDMPLMKKPSCVSLKNL